VPDIAQQVRLVTGVGFKPITFRLLAIGVRIGAPKRRVIRFDRWHSGGHLGAIDGVKQFASGDLFNVRTPPLERILTLG
jgi:hypothetical protein